nr:response regulator transcription factor [uncultured Prevotella sp.]
MTHYIIADNQELTRAGLKAIIRSKFPGEISIADDKTELILQLKEHPESIIFLDYTLFDFNDASNLMIAADRFTGTQWILISEDLTTDFIGQIYYSSRNISVLFKDTPVNDIANAIRAAQEGNRFFSQRAVELLLNQRQKEEVETNLTQTEIEILKAIAQGKTTKEIANERFSSIHTINTHRKNIFRKIGVNSAHEAIKYAFRSGLVDTNEFYI